MGAKREMNTLENNPKFNTEKLDSALTEKDEFLATPEAKPTQQLSTQRAENTKYEDAVEAKETAIQNKRVEMKALEVQSNHTRVWRRKRAKNK